MRPVIVTGADGFAGRHVVRHLLDAGRRVEAWVHRAPSSDLRCPHRVLDIRDARACADALAAADPSGLIHLAAVTSVADAAARPGYAHAVNVVGTHNVLGPLRPGIPAVLASTCHVYRMTGAMPLDESMPVDPVGPYASTKAEAEVAARSAHPSTVVARAFHHTGPGQAPRFALAQWARDLELGEETIRTGDLTLRRDYSDVRDIAAGYVWLLGHAAAGETVNLCSGRAPTLRALLDQLAPDGVTAMQNPAWLRAHDPAEIRGCPERAARLGWRVSTPMATTLADLRASLRRPAAC